MTHVFEGHVENPQPGPAVDFDAVIENVRLFSDAFHEQQRQQRGSVYNTPPIMELNVRLLQDWGAILYPEGHEVVPFIRPVNSTIRDLKVISGFGDLFSPKKQTYDDDLMRALVAEIACEIMGWNIYHGSERGWTICPHVPIRPWCSINPMTFEPEIHFRTSFGWLDNRKNK